jgi:hypothetical protein
MIMKVMATTNLESVKVRLFQTIDAYSSFERIKIIYKTYKLSKEEKLYVMKRIIPKSFTALECK